MPVSRCNPPDGLLEDIKNARDITWFDEATDRKMLGYITAGMVYINNKLGEEADYTLDGLPRTLLFEYVRYAMDAALDVFENNYMSVLLSMQHRRAVKRYVESTEQTE